MFTLKFRHKLTGPVKDELDQLVTSLRDYLLVAHDQDGNLDATGLDISNLDASSLSTGTVPLARLPTIGASKLDLSAIAQDLAFAGDQVIRRTTSDGSDSGYLILAGGGGASGARGASVQVFGNEYSGFPGCLGFYPGNITNSKIALFRNDGNIAFQIDGATGEAYLPYAQLRFPTSTNASSDAQTLDQYKEGTWTPTDGSGAGLSITVNTAYYIKIGQFVMAWYDITFPATASGAQAVLASLPFSSQSSSAPGGFSTYDGSGQGLFWNMQGATSQAYAYKAGGTAVTNANLSGATLRGVIMYRAGS